MGVAICTPIVGIPPRNVLVAFEKPFEDRKRGIAFNRGCCWGMRTITAEDFLEGTNHARKIRGWSARRNAYGSFFGPEGNTVGKEGKPSRRREQRTV